MFIFFAIILFLILAATEAALYGDKYGALTYEDIIHSNDAERIHSFCIKLGFHQYFDYPEC